MPGSAARVDLANRAMCHALRNPPPGTKRSSLKQIAGLVVKTDGTHPSEEAVREAAIGSERRRISGVGRRLIGKRRDKKTE